MLGVCLKKIYNFYDTIFIVNVSTYLQPFEFLLLIAIKYILIEHVSFDIYFVLLLEMIYYVKGLGKIKANN